MQHINVFVMMAGLTALCPAFEVGASLFRTHPATEERVARLLEQASRGGF